MTLLGRKSNGKALLSHNFTLSHFCSLSYRPSTPGLKKQWCPEIVELIEHMWSQEPQDRPAISEVVGYLDELYAKF